MPGVATSFRHKYMAHTKSLAVACLSTLVFDDNADISKLVMLIYLYIYFKTTNQFLIRCL